MKLLALILLPFLALAAAAMMDLQNGFYKSPVDPPKFPVSVITPDQATSVFKDMARDKDIPFRYPVDGCYARATEMSRIAEKKNIITGRVYIEGGLTVTTPLKEYPIVHWGWHVAPVAYVKQPNGSVKLTVFDPSLFNQPVPLEQWEHKMMTKVPGHKDPYISRVYYGDRFQYWRPKMENTRLGWDPNVLISMKDKFALYSPRQDFSDGAPASKAAKKFAAPSEFNEQGQVTGPGGSTQ